MLYFKFFSGKPIPAAYEKPKYDLEYYKTLARIRYVPESWERQHSFRDKPVAVLCHHHHLINRFVTMRIWQETAQ